MIKKTRLLILSILLLGTTSFAAGFDSPTEAFLYWYKVANNAQRFPHGKSRYDVASVNKLLPHTWSKRKRHALMLISQHWKYVHRAKKRFGKKYPLNVNLKYSKPYKISAGDQSKGGMSIAYTHFDFQAKRKWTNRIQFTPRKVGNKIKWFYN